MDKVMNDGIDLSSLTGVLRTCSHFGPKMSILFSDTRSFTTLPEGMTPDENFAFINACLERMEPTMRDHNGFIDKDIRGPGREPDQGLRQAAADLGFHPSGVGRPGDLRHPAG